MAGKEALGKKLVLKYFELGATGGRGSVVRYLLYVHDVEFEEEKVAPDDSWLTVKEELVKSGHNPCGSLPVLYIDDQPYCGHIPIARLLAAKLGAVSTDPVVLYRSNAMLDEYTSRRNAWGDALFDEEKKKLYIADTAKSYALIEKLYEMRSDKSTPYFMGMEKPGYDDLCVYSMIYDDQQFCGEMELEPYPTLKALYTKVKEIPRIAEWIKQAQAATAAAEATQ